MRFGSKQTNVFNVPPYILHNWPETCQRYSNTYDSLQLNNNLLNTWYLWNLIVLFIFCLISVINEKSDCIENISDKQWTVAGLRRQLFYLFEYSMWIFFVIAISHSILFKYATDVEISCNSLIQNSKWVK